MKDFKTFLSNAVFSERYSLDARMVNLISLLGVATVLVALILRIATGVPVILDVLVALIAVACFVFLILHIKLNMFKMGKWILAISFCDILIPIAFFFLGGIDSSISAFFVLTAVVFYMLMSGRARIVLLITHFVIVAACFLLGYLFPELVYTLTMEQRLVDQYFSVIIVACFIGTVFIFQRVLFEREQKKVASSNVLLENSLRQHALTASISQSFVANTGASTDELIISALAKVGEFFAVDRAVIVVNDPEDSTIEIHYSWVCDEKWDPAPVSKMGLEDVVISNFSEDPPRDDEASVVTCTDIFNDCDGRFHMFEKVGVRAFIWNPIYVDGRLWGVLSIESCEHTRSWSVSDIALASSINSAFTGAISRDITSKALEAALEQATQASKAKGDFLANMSHEIRTPLNAVVGMTSIGKRSNDIDRKDYAFDKIEDASNHLIGIVNDVLDMSKIEANKLELSHVSFNFENMLRKVVNVINFKVEQRQQIFHVSIDPNIPRMLVGDDQRLAQVVSNLLSNAVKFTPEGGEIHLSTQLLEECDGNCIVQFTVTDTGIGVTDEQKGRLFTSFEQAESGTSRKFGGTGLGLAISKRIVELMGGEIWLESEPGEGSTFTFTAKIRRADAEAEGAGQSELLSSGVGWRNIRIIAVDDDEVILDFFKDLSEQIGISCDTAASGEEALRLLEENGEYDIYFIDWRMPEMSGIELSSAIREKSDKRSVVTLISAIELSEVEYDARCAGVDMFLTKPLFPSMVTELITECIGSAKVIHDAAQASGGAGAGVEARGANAASSFSAGGNAALGTDAGDEELDYTETFPDCRILLAEDIDINREIVISLLESTMLEIDTAENGVVALSKFAEQPERYQMIFMDVQMPEMDGLEATRQIRALSSPWAKDVPIIAMTANVFREDVEKCLKAGMNDHVGKPIYLDEVLAKLRQYLPVRAA